MGTTADDNFFIEEPQKLRNNFFNRDKSVQIVELLAQKHHHGSPVQKKAQQFHPSSISHMMRKPEYKMNSEEHVVKLLKQVQHTLDYREQKTVDCLSVILDDHFVELVKTDEVVDVIDHLSAYIDAQCALMREIENTKCLLQPIVELLDNNNNNNNDNQTNNQLAKGIHKSNTKRPRHTRIYHTVEYLEL